MCSQLMSNSSLVSPRQDIPTRIMSYFTYQNKQYKIETLYLLSESARRSRNKKDHYLDKKVTYGPALCSSRAYETCMEISLCVTKM